MNSNYMPPPPSQQAMQQNPPKKTEEKAGTGEIQCTTNKEIEDVFTTKRLYSKGK